MYTKFRSGNLKGKALLKYLGVGGNITVIYMTKQQRGRIRSDFIWLELATNGSLV
jgi:hypothetical protein